MWCSRRRILGSSRAGGWAPIARQCAAAPRRALDGPDIGSGKGGVARVVRGAGGGGLGFLSPPWRKAGMGGRPFYTPATSGNLVELAVVPDNPLQARRVLEASLLVG